MISCKIPLRVLETILLLVLLFPLLISCISVLIFIRFLIVKLAKYVRKDLDEIVTGRSSGFALDIFYNYEKPTLPIVVTITLEGKPVDLKVLQHEVSRILLEGKGVEEIIQKQGNKTVGTVGSQLNRNSRHHRMTQYVVSWFGLFFWKTDSKFHIANHVRAINVPSSIEESVAKLQSDLLCKPFIKNQSPWELIQVRSIRGSNNSALILRIHHVLGDGHSILNFLINELCNKSGKLPQLPPQHRSKNDSQLSSSKAGNCCKRDLTYGFRAAYHLVKYLGEAHVQDIFKTKSMKLSRRHITFDPEQSYSSNTQICISQPIPWKIFKKIKEHHQASFTAILLTGLGSALREYLLREGLEVPNSISCFILLPVPGHPEAFSNHMTGCIIQVPLGNLSPATRLSILEKNFQNAKNSTFPSSFYLLTEIIGLPFRWLTKPFFGNAFATSVSSNFVGPPEKIVYHDSTVTGCTFLAGFGPGNVSLAMTSLSYDSHVRVGLTLNFPLVPVKNHAVSILENVGKELHVLL